MNTTPATDTVRYFDAASAPADIWGIQGQAGWYWRRSPDAQWQYAWGGEQEARFNAGLQNARTK